MSKAQNSSSASRQVGCRIGESGDRPMKRSSTHSRPADHNVSVQLWNESSHTPFARRCGLALRS